MQMEKKWGKMGYWPRNSIFPHFFSISTFWGIWGASKDGTFTILIKGGLDALVGCGFLCKVRPSIRTVQKESRGTAVEVVIQ
eukprot:1139790-Amphidinium_carterae.1